MSRGHPLYLISPEPIGDDYRPVWRRAAVMANSRGLRELAWRTAKHQPVSVIPNGVDRGLFRPAEAGEREASETVRLAGLAGEYGVSVGFLGNVAHDELAELYRAHDAFVLPSRNEGMSSTVLEAMASGLPVIVTDVVGTAELVEDNGVRVPVDDEAALREAVVSLRDDPGKRVEMGERSREIALEYSWERVVEEYLRLYGEVAK